jgi:two-component system sensor histidine kinase KdpD
VALGVSARRQVAGSVTAVVLLAILTPVLAQMRDDVPLATDLLLYLLVVVIVAAIGGAWVAFATAVAAFLLVNYYFTPPLHEFTVAHGHNIVALIVFLIVAGVVSVFVTLAGRRAAEAARARAEAGALVQLAGSLLSEDDSLGPIMEQLLHTFGLQSVAVLRPTASREWGVVAHAGEASLRSPNDASATVELPTGDLFAYCGPDLTADDRRVLNAFVSQLAVALASRELRAEASSAAALAEADALRTALLRAVSHDLRTPLASIKAAVSTLLAHDLHLDDDTIRQLHQTIDEQVDRLDELVHNLLAMSRLQAGALRLANSDVALDEVVGRALVSLGDRAAGVVVDVSDTLPHVCADPALLERAVANVVDNALSWSPPNQPVRLEAGCVRDRVVLRVIDRGPGIAPADRDRVFQPFQRLGDAAPGGVGLGLAVARGFTEALGGELRVDDTPGGGTTMEFSFERNPADLEDAR